jgi:hypothetical protein
MEKFLMLFIGEEKLEKPQAAILCGEMEDILSVLFNCETSDTVAEYSAPYLESKHQPRTQGKEAPVESRRSRRVCLTFRVQFQM